MIMAKDSSMAPLLRFSHLGYELCDLKRDFMAISRRRFLPMVAVVLMIAAVFAGPVLAAPVLLFDDTHLSLKTWMDALTGLGHSVTRVTNDSGFSSALSAGGWSLVVVHWGNTGHSQGATDLSNYVAGGGKAIFGHWRTEADGAFGVSQAGINNNTLTITDAAFSAGLSSSVLGLTNLFYGIYSRSFITAEVIAATFEDGFAGIVVGNSGRTIVNGFLEETLPYSDEVRLYQNEVNSLIGEVPTPPSNVQVTAPTSGQTISGTFAFKGTAQDDSGIIQKVEFYIDSDSTPACSDTAAKSSGSTFQCNWDTSTKPDGSHTVKAKAYDPSNNSAFSSSVSFNIANSGKDLVIENLTLSASNLAPGDSTSVRYRIANRGTVKVTEDYTEKIYLSRDGILDGSDVLLGTSHLHTTDLEPNATHTASQSVVIPPGTPPGSYFILVDADALGVVSENSEGNNVASVSLAVTGGGIDLKITSMGFAPTSATAGITTLEVTFTVTNLGASALGPFSNQIFLSTDSAIGAADTLLGTVDTSGLAPGESRTILVSGLTVPATTAPGNYFLGVYADPLNTISEYNEDNNTLVGGPIEVSDQPWLKEDAGDTNSLGLRIPLILVNGICSNAERWGTQENPGLIQAVQDRLKNFFKMYLFQYPSSDPATLDHPGGFICTIAGGPDNPPLLGHLPDLYSVAGVFAKRVAEYRALPEDEGGWGNKKIAIVAHSQGGLVARSYMEQHFDKDANGNDVAAGENVLALFTLGTPHHGVWPVVLDAPYGDDMGFDDYDKSAPTFTTNMWLRCINNVQNGCGSSDS